MMGLGCCSWLGVIGFGINFVFELINDDDVVQCQEVGISVQIINGIGLGWKVVWIYGFNCFEIIFMDMGLGCCFVK